MKPRDERILWLFGATVIAAAALGVVLVPAAGTYATLRTELDDARGALAVAERSGSVLQSLERKQEELDNRLATLDAMFASRGTAVAFLAGLEALGDRYGVAATPAFTTEPTAAVQVVPLRIAVTGPLEGVLRYAEAVTAQQPVISLNAVDLVGSSTVTLTLHAEVAWR